MIIVNTQQGLANRLRVIESGMSLSYKLNTSLKVIWKVDNNMVAAFTDLFIVPDKFIIIPENSYKYVRSTFRFFGIKKFLSSTINLLYGVHKAFDNFTIISHLVSKNKNIEEFSKQKTYLFSTYEVFYPFNYKYSWLRPIPVIQQKIEQFESRISGRYCIGIHIRRTDNITSIKESPDTVFENAMDLEILKNTDVLFLLATDDQLTEKKFIKKYGGKIITTPKKFGRDTIAATQDAVVDLISLSKCKKLYCSFWSSFSETAATISGGEIIICKKYDQ